MEQSETSYRGTIIAIILCVLWVASIGLIGSLGYYEALRNAGHNRVLITTVVPTVFFVVLFVLLPSVRAWTHSLNPAMLALPHAWRTVGFSFLALWAYGILPAGFAAPAGLGDFTIGMAAPFIAVALWLQWKGATRLAVWFHLFGLLDLSVASLTAVTAFGVIADQMNQIDPMTTFPMVLIPTVPVPLLFSGHIIALLNLFMRRSGK